MFALGCDSDNREPTALGGAAAAPPGVHRGAEVPTQTVNVGAVHRSTTAQTTHSSGKEKSFLLTLVSLYAYIHNFKVVFSRKYWIKNTPMFA